MANELNAKYNNASQWSEAFSSNDTIEVTVEQSSVDFKYKSAYVFAYDLTDQSNLSSSYAPISFSNSGILAAWSHDSNDSEFTCNQSGIYLINYNVNIKPVSALASCQASARIALKLSEESDFNEIVGSQSSLLINSILSVASMQNLSISGSAIVSLSFDDVIRLEASGSNALIGLSGANTQISSRITIARIG